MKESIEGYENLYLLTAIKALVLKVVPNLIIKVTMGLRQARVDGLQ